MGGLVREMWRAHPLATLASLALLFVGNARTGLYVASMGGIVDALIEGRSTLFWVLVFVLANAMEEFYYGARSVLYAYLLDHATYRLQRRVLTHASAAPLIQFEEGEFFIHLQRASDDMGGRLQRVWTAMTDCLQVAIMLGSVGIALFFVHPALLPLLVAGALPAIWLQARTANAVYKAQREHTAGDRVREHLERLLTGREAAPEVRLFGSAPYLLARWRGLRRARTRDVLGAEKRRALAGVLGGLVSGAAYAAALVFVARLILGGRLSVGEWVTVATGALWFEGIMGAFVLVARGIAEETQYLGDLFDFLRVARVEPTRQAGPGAVSTAHRLPPPGAGARGMALEAEGLSFSYPGRAVAALRGVSVSIARGEKVAIVGENGAGKTTLVRLLMGLYEPDEGRVRVDGEPLAARGVGVARDRIAALFQDYATFQLTARENIGFGDPARMGDDRRLARAAGRAGIADLIEGLPEKYDAYLGRQFGEVDLSGGQWQRVALARAFFRDADLLVLDEPTAALDPLAELALFQRFAELVEGRTAIMISHRLGAARLADRVIVLREGRIVEQGRHDALVAGGGLYASMFAAQAQWYR
jgi:ATP-binding cassette subfamily B protein